MYLVEKTSWHRHKTNPHYPHTIMLYICKGFWNDNGDTFEGMLVDSETWNGIEDLRDEKIYFYAEGGDIIGEHDEFTITHAEPIKIA